MNYENIFSLSGKTAVVTGGAGLIGSRIAGGLKDFGARVFAADIAEPRGEGSKPEDIPLVRMDITSEESVLSTFSDIYGRTGRIDVLINCAYPRTEDWGEVFENVSFESWKDNVNSHLGGYFLSSKTAAAFMKKNSSGSIVNLSSIYGFSAPDFTLYEGTGMTLPAPYSAIKGGIISFTRYLASYLGKYNIRVNAISPGGVFDGQDGIFVERYIKKTPLNRMAAPGDIVGAAVFLSSGASEYITGQNIAVDGGWACK